MKYWNIFLYFPENRIWQIYANLETICMKCQYQGNSLSPLNWARLVKVNDFRDDNNNTSRYDDEDDMIWCFMSLSTLIRWYQDDGRTIMKGTMQWSTLQSWGEFHLQRDSNLGLHDPVGSPNNPAIPHSAIGHFIPADNVLIYFPGPSCSKRR